MKKEKPEKEKTVRERIPQCIYGPPEAFGGRSGKIPPMFKADNNKQAKNTSDGKTDE